MRLRHAFSLVELLLVVAILAALLVLLVPALQSSRETARRAHCARNLKQLGIAVHSYHTAHRRIPLGAVMADRTYLQYKADHKGSFFVQLLPFIEESSLYSQLDFSNDVELSIERDSGRPIHEHLIPLLVCPSDYQQNYYPGGGAVSARLHLQSAQKAISNYAPSIGNQAIELKYWENCGLKGNSFGTGSTQYADIQAHTEGNKVSGVVAKWGWSCRFAEIPDGLSKTILLGEIRPHCSYQARDGWMSVNAFFFSTTSPINFPTCPEEQGHGSGYCNFYYRMGTAMGFKSRHPDGAQFAYADGSVHFRTESSDYQIYQRLGDRRDGLPTAE